MVVIRRAIRALARTVAASFAIFGVVGLCWANSGSQQGSQQPAGQSAASKAVGTIKAINGSAITLTTDAGAEVNVAVAGAARIVRIAPGQKDLKNAMPIQLQDLQLGDRILVFGKPSDDGKSVKASAVVAMKHSDVEAKQQHEREEWQKNGVGGLVGAVDPTTGTVTISVTTMGGKKNIAVHARKNTVVRRYSPDSVKFDDAKSSTLYRIKPGDQLRARGIRSPDGTEVAADEIVSGSFRNIAGTVTSINPSGNTIGVLDLITKKPVQVKFTAESQLRKLPVEMAQRIATRLKGGATGGGTAGEVRGGAAVTGARADGAAQASEASGYGPGAGSRAGGSPDLQQILNRMPIMTVSDLHKGEAVMIVSTEGAASEVVTAITLLSGVEPILAATPSGSGAMILAPWSPGGAMGSEDATP